MIPTVFGSGILVFFLMRVIPGDICLTRWVDFGANLDPYILDLCRHKLGLNKPILSQFWEFFTNILTLDFGVSMWTGNDMAEELKPTPASEELSRQFGKQLALISRKMPAYTNRSPWNDLRGWKDLVLAIDNCKFYNKDHFMK